MITIHYNGEIVRHADHKERQNRKIERYDKEKRCKYGITEIHCSVWVDLCKQRPEIKSISSFGSCTLSGCKNCPQYKQRKEAGNTKKQYIINGGTYRKLASGAHHIVKNSFNKTLFLTLTFPPYLKKHTLTKSFIHEYKANQAFSKFCENLKKTYKAEYYIAVRERGENNGRLHFHLVVSIPFSDFGELNRAWCCAISDYCEFSNNAVQTRAGQRVIKTPARAIRYICKYISKSVNIASDTRLYFISNNTLTEKYVNEQTGEITRRSNIKRKIYENPRQTIYSILEKYKSIEIRTFEYVSTFRITDIIQFNRFCNEFIYPLYTCENNAVNLYLR